MLPCPGSSRYQKSRRTSVEWPFLPPSTHREGRTRGASLWNDRARPGLADLLPLEPHSLGLLGPTGFAHSHQQRDDGPLRASPEMAALQGKSGRVRESAPFGGRNGLVCLFLTDARSTATTGAWPSPTGWPGDDHGAPPPSPDRREPHG